MKMVDEMMVWLKLVTETLRETSSLFSALERRMKVWIVRV